MLLFLRKTKKTLSFWFEIILRTRTRINISKERLQYIFEKDATAKMVEKVIDAGNIETADEVYEKWKEENTISGEMCWEDITFGNHIFTVEDIILYEDETKN